MDEMESKMNSILGNPEMMQQIMAMAQSLNASQESKEEKKEQVTQEQPKSEPFMNLNMDSMQKLAGLAGNSRIDRNQQTLLKALGPYLNRDRIAKLEKAMRSAKMATLASSFLGNSGLLFKSGR